MTGTTFEAAIEKARVKRAVAEQLATLSPEARRDVLADLLLELDGPPTSFAGAIARTQLNGVVRGHGAKKPARGPAPGAGRPKGAIATSGGGRTAAVVDALKARPGTPIAELAKIAYPELPEGSDDANHKVRAILFSLKKQGRIKNVGTGKWEAVSKD